MAANLEDISRFGACLQMERMVPRDTEMVVRCDRTDLYGTVRYCLYRDSSYFVGIEFSEGTRWSRLWYRPQHMLDPRELVLQSEGRVVRSLRRNNLQTIQLCRSNYRNELNGELTAADNDGESQVVRGVHGGIGEDIE